MACRAAVQASTRLGWPARPGALRMASNRTTAASQAAGHAVVRTEEAPAALGPYSQGVKAGRMLFVSGQLGARPGIKEFVAPDAAGQCAQALENIGAILRAGGGDFQNVVKTTILLADMADFGSVNDVYGGYFPKDPPARATYAVQGLPLNARVEIEAVALLPETAP